AQSCGAPVIVVHGGGAEYTILHEPDPILADSSSPRDLHAAVEKQIQRNDFVDDREERRERIIRHFGKDTTCGLLLDLYEMICEENGTNLESSNRSILSCPTD
ncbi:MAG: hypothetical protein JXR25_08365, partial [Pontiellaceae bacterium]|nr:hypothetical protein [Pontiellaceae bacterium]